MGRIVITPKAIQVRDDSTEVKGKTPSTLLATAKLDLKQGTWHKLRYEWSGERMAAKLDDVSVEGSNANLAKNKIRWWFCRRWCIGEDSECEGLRCAGRRLGFRF